MHMISAIAGLVMLAGSNGLAADTGEPHIKLPSGFKAQVFADGIGPVRHMAAGLDGWVYAALYRAVDDMGAVALRDQDGDGIADETHYFARGGRGTGMRLHGGYLYFGEDQRIVRWPVSAAEPVPAGEGEVLVDGFPAQRAHAAKTMAFDGAGHVYVNVGVPSNACMKETRTKGSPGQRPCPELKKHGGIYRFDLDRTGQDFNKDGYRFSTGHRNAVALDWNGAAAALYLVQHGRDQLGQFFPELYDDLANAELPAEEFHRVNEGDDLGWPYSYYDHRVGARMLSPEYGGDGKTRSNEGKKPILAFPGHWAPNGLLFHSGAGLPQSYAHGTFIAFHGSWNRAPEVQQGYRVVFVPMDANGNITGQWQDFATGFPGPEPVKSPRDALHRPTGLAEGADGAIYISSMMSGGRIWRVTYAQ